MATSTIVASSNAAQQKELKLLKQIKVEQNFANQAYANFQTIRFGIESCCYTDFANAVVEKDLCDWQNAASTKVVAATEIEGIFVEPLASVNLQSSMSCPATPSNVCTILDLAEIIADSGTYTFCQDAPLAKWTITHNLGMFPSVTVVDSGNSTVIGNVEYTNSNILTVTFASAFSGCAYLN
jgi:hypothetical protein|tara:strand:+ start:447 stop:992 length:546 start_codon:yes stop_codon:yes gene_type:complete